MIQFELQKLDNIWSVLPQKTDFVVIGEMHGSEQNAPLVQKFAQALLTQAHHITIAFEWTMSREFNNIRDYIHGGASPENLPAFFLNSDGRVTYEHFDLLRWIRSYNREHHSNIDIYAFDVSSGNENPEQMLANALLSHKAQQPDSLFLVETGNMHARNVPYTFDKEFRVPMAAFLKKTSSVFSIFIKYMSGNVLVDDIPRDVTKAASQIESPEPYFDGVVNIPESRATLEISDLTDVLQKFKLPPERR